MFETVADYGAPVLVLYILLKMFQEFTKWMKTRNGGSGETTKAIETATKEELDQVVVKVDRIYEIVTAITPSGSLKVWSPAEPLEELIEEVKDLKALIKEKL